MTDTGKVTHTEGVHRAECLREDCTWKIESKKDGEVAHKLMDHNTEEHS